LKIYKKTLYSGEKYQINAKSNDAITYTVENKYHATVSESSLVTAAFVGQTKIRLDNGNNSKKFKLTVAPKYNLYTLPNVRFGEPRTVSILKLGTPDQ
jgi:hypothetical protein